MQIPTDAILENVKRIAYDGDPRSDRFIIGLDAVLQHMGEKEQYVRLLGMSGRAFRVIWLDDKYYPERYKESDQADITSGIYDFKSIRTALEATGYEFTTRF